MSPEAGPLVPAQPEAAPARVNQPLTMSNQLQEFLSGLDVISETSPGGPGEHWTGGAPSGGMTAQAGGQASGTSPRDQAIANLPAPAVMQKEIAKHIKVEIKKLRREAKRIARVGQPGGAYHLVQLYGKIHRLNALLKEIFDSSLEVIKRIYVRIFIDRQPI
jgi:hypothetical protein